MKDHLNQPRPGLRTPGDITVAALLAAGAAIERLGGARGSRPHRGLIAAVPVIGVNTVAFLGQLTYWRTWLPVRAEQVLVAVVLESVAIYLAYQAHLARKADDSAFRLQLAAYLVAAGVGAMNYSHFMHPGWRPTVAALTFGGASAISPWLWGVHSRRESRDDLKARGLIEDHAVRLGGTRWFWHFAKCLHVTWLATWIGENRPAEAIRLIGHEPEAAPQAPARPQTPPPAPQQHREPRLAKPPRAARAARPAAARPGAVRAAYSDRERELIERLAGLPDSELPSARSLAADELDGSRRRAAAVLNGVQLHRLGGLSMNGSGHGADHRA